MLKIVQYKVQIISGIIEQAKLQKEILETISTADMVHILMGSFRLMMLKWKISKFQLNLIEQGNALMQININLLTHEKN